MDGQVETVPDRGRDIHHRGEVNRDNAIKVDSSGVNKLPTDTRIRGIVRVNKEIRAVAKKGTLAMENAVVESANNQSKN